MGRKESVKRGRVGEGTEKESRGMGNCRREGECERGRRGMQAVGMKERGEGKGEAGMKERQKQWKHDC